MNIRQIKFRAWNGKEMINTGTIHETTRESGYEMWDGDTHEYYPVMQYTGLKDCNGKEVFEGDIVKCSRGCPHEIVWREASPFSDCGGWQIKGVTKEYDWIGCEEYIGNVFENPNLLTNQ